MLVGEHRVEPVGHGADQVRQERCGRLDGGALLQVNEGELGDPVDGHEEVKLAFGGAHLGDVDVELADRIALERLECRLVALDLRQPTDPTALRTAMQR